MKNIIFLLLITLCAASCGSVKKSLSLKKSASDSSGSLKAVVASNTKTDATTVTDTKEHIDSPTVVPGDTVNGERSASDLLAGKKLIVDNGTTKVIVTYDKETGNYKATGITKPRTINTGYTKETHSTANVKASNNTTAKITASTEVKKSNSDKEKSKEREPIPFWYWIVLILIIAGIVYVVYRYFFH